MNPLDLTGPEFLRFFIPYGICVLALAWLIRSLFDRDTEAAPSVRWMPGAYPWEGDAYAIAFLRGGRREAVRTVLGRLVSTGLVNVEDRLVRALPGSGKDEAQLQPIEAAAWSVLKPGEPIRAGRAERYIQAALGTHLREIEDELTREGLLPQRERRAALRALAVVTWLAVGGLGLAKIVVALSRGKSNLGFLILLLIGFHLLFKRLLRSPQQTAAARQYLDWLRQSHRGLVSMLESGRRNSVGEMALAAGIYGLAEVSDLRLLDRAFQPPPSTSGGSSCSSSSCSSGSSCGGGGCGGGGCGGCGG